MTPATIAYAATDTEAPAALSALALQEAQDGLRGVIGRLEIAADGADTLQMFRLAAVKLEIETQMRALALMGEP